MEGAVVQWGACEAAVGEWARLPLVDPASWRGRGPNCMTCLPRKEKLVRPVSQFKAVELNWTCVSHVKFALCWYVEETVFLLVNVNYSNTCFLWRNCPKVMGSSPWCSLQLSRAPHLLGGGWFFSCLLPSIPSHRVGYLCVDVCVWRCSLFTCKMCVCL